MNQGRGMTWQEMSAMLGLVTLASVFLFEPSLTIARAGTAAWLVTLGGGLIFLLMALAMGMMYHRHITQRDGKCSFVQFLSSCVGQVGQKAIYFIWIGLLAMQLVMMLRLASDSMAKIALQQGEILLPIILFGMGIILAAHRAIDAVLRAGYLVLIGVSVLLGLLALLLMPLWEIELIFPWQGFGYGATICEMGSEVGAWCVGSVAFLLFPRMQGQTACRSGLVRGAVLTIIVKCVVIVSALFIFGSVVGGERSLLVYEMAKLVHFSQYIQRVEAIFVCAWAMVVFLCMVILVQAMLILIGEIFQLRDTKPLIGLTVVWAVVCASLIEDTAIAHVWSEVLAYRLAPLFFVAVFLAMAISVGCRREMR